MTTLEDLQNGKEAKVIGIQKGFGFSEKMCSMNIRTGKTIKKITSQPFKGPVIVKIDDRQCAIGRGMARKVMVEEI